MRAHRRLRCLSLVLGILLAAPAAANDERSWVRARMYGVVSTVVALGLTELPYVRRSDGSTGPLHPNTFIALMAGVTVPNTHDGLFETQVAAGIGMVPISRFELPIEVTEFFNVSAFRLGAGLTWHIDEETLGGTRNWSSAPEGPLSAQLLVEFHPGRTGPSLKRRNRARTLSWTAMGLRYSVRWVSPPAGGYLASSLGFFGGFYF